MKFRHLKSQLNLQGEMVETLSLFLEGWINREIYGAKYANDNDTKNTKLYQTEAETKLPPFSRRRFQMHLFEWKCINFAEDFTEVYS